MGRELSFNKGQLLVREGQSLGNYHVNVTINDDNCREIMMESP